MSIKVECPRCRKALAVPNRKAGSYVNCPECQGRFWVPESAPAEPAPARPGAAAPPPAATRATPPPSTTKPLPPKPAPPDAPPGKPAAPPPARDAAARKTARLIASDAAAPTIELAADGKMPELQLRETDKGPDRQAKQSSMHPMTLVLLLIGSVLASILLVTWDVPGGDTGQLKEQAREEIRQKFFFSPDGKLQPYQEWLREAQRAASRGDRVAERRLYLRVLDALRAERPVPGAQLTANDEELERLIADILRE
ncbi:MAG: hypothetical protein JW809_18670 [Pirellulales bacterium]|nr:hypothetical protein [Pirellulales bacterium]